MVKSCVVRRASYVALLLLVPALLRAQDVIGIRIRREVIEAARERNIQSDTNDRITHFNIFRAAIGLVSHLRAKY